MELLKKIIVGNETPVTGSTVYREAVRGIIANDSDLLMVYSTQNGDYKFPGGGLAEGETHQQALEREIREECGAIVEQIGPEFGKVIEYIFPSELDYDVFQMTSYYYHCHVAASVCKPSLEKYEEELGFQPVWINIDEAIRINKTLIDGSKKTSWIHRETFVLEQIRQRFFLSQ